MQSRLVQAAAWLQGRVQELCMFRFASATVMALVAVLAASRAEADGVYVSATIGGAFRDPLTSHLSDTTDPFGNQAFQNGAAVPYRLTEKTHFQAGGQVDIAGGYRFGLARFGALRVEGEFGFRDYRVSDSEVQSLPNQVYGTNFHSTITTLKGNYVERYAETANIFYDLPSVGFVTPYLGAGAGYAENTQTSATTLSQFQDTRSATGSIFGPTPSTSGTAQRQVASSYTQGGLWQVEGGLGLKMTQHLSLVPSYRFSRSFNGATPTHLARLGIRYSF
jgi:opacity protein-like surface antigen